MARTVSDLLIQATYRVSTAMEAIGNVVLRPWDGAEHDTPDSPWFARSPTSAAIAPIRWQDRQPAIDSQPDDVAYPTSLLFRQACALMHRDAAQFARLQDNPWPILIWELAGHVVAAAVILIYGLGTRFRTSAVVAVTIFIGGHVLLTGVGGPFRMRLSTGRVRFVLYQLAISAVILSFCYLTVRHFVAVHSAMPFHNAFLFTLASTPTVRALSLCVGCLHACMQNPKG